MAWTKAQDKKLRSLVKNYGPKWSEIGEALRRTRDATRRRASHLGIKTEPDWKKKAALLEKQLLKSEAARENFAERIRGLSFSHSTPIGEYTGREARIGLVSDSHFGSLWERLDLVKKAYAIMHRLGIKTVLHAGDVMEGTKMRPGHEFELALVGSDAQEEHVRNEWPEYKGMKTHFILGSHDLSFFKNTGHNPGKAIERKDLRFLRKQSMSKHGICAQFPIKVGGTKIIIEMVHPAGGTAYALSHQPQKYVESLSGGTKPHLVIMGHYHKMLFAPQYRNVDVILPGCLQSQTDWMRSKRLAAMLGFVIIHIRATKVGLASVGAEFTHFYEGV